MRDGSDLCLQCGICCGSACFTDGPLEPDEVEPFRIAGGNVFVWSDDRGDHVSHGFPCMLWVDRKCSVFGQDSRPRDCARFTCFLLDGYLAGVRSLSECSEVIAGLRAAEDELARLGGRTHRKNPDPEALMAAAALDVLIRRHVRVP